MIIKFDSLDSFLLKETKKQIFFIPWSKYWKGKRMPRKSS